jgi:hypothetical protein
MYLCRIVVSALWIVVGLHIDALAQPQTITEPKAFTEAFFRRILEDPESAFKLVREETPLGRSGQLSVATEQMRNILRNNGVVLSYEFIDEKQLGKSLRRYDYLLNQRVKPAMFQLTFYNAQNGWQLIHMYFSDAPDKLPFR